MNTFNYEDRLMTFGNLNGGDIFQYRDGTGQILEKLQYLDGATILYCPEDEVGTVRCYPDEEVVLVKKNNTDAFGDKILTQEEFYNEN